MKLELSKINYFLILVTLLISIDSILYFNMENLPTIMLYIIVLLIPLITLIKHTYGTNTRVLDKQVPKFVYNLIDFGLTILVVAQVSLLVDSLSWLISGNPAVVNNISNSGYWLVAMILYIASHNLSNRQNVIKICTYILAIFDLILIPMILIYIISSNYGGLLAQSTLGQLDMTINTVVKIFPLLSILLFARNNRTEEQKIGNMLYPALSWMILVFSLAVLAISGSTLEIGVVNDSSYAVKFFENLQQAHVLNVFDYDVATIAAGYQFLNSTLVLLLLTLIKEALYEKSCVYVRKNEYIADEEMKIVYKKYKARNNMILFALLIGFIALISPSLHDLTTLVSNWSTIAALIINFIFIAIISIHYIKQASETRFIKSLSIYLIVVSAGLIIFYFV